MFGNQFRIGSVGVLQHPGYNKGGKGGGSPAAPDTVGAAQATAAGNLEAARATAAANRVNQYTPYGNLVYAPTEKDTFGNQLYQVTQTLSPAEQQKLDLSNTLESGLLNTAQTGLNYAQGVLSKPGVDMSKLPQMPINAGETYSDAIMRRLQPTMTASQSAFDTKMANQGIAPGSEAYANANRQFQQGQNDLLTSAQIQGMNTGLGAQQQAFQQQAYNQMQPINVINALRTGTQVDNPNFVSPVQQANTGGADLLGAANSQYQNELAGYNAQQAASGNFMGGLMNLGGTLGAAYLMSDINLKENIKKVGSLDNGINLYSYNYKDGYDLPKGKQVGVMAQEVEKVIPEAVTEIGGFKAVNYALLGV